MKRLMLALVGLMVSVNVAFAAVTISTSAKTLEKAGGAASVTISGTGEWTAVPDVSWIVIRQGASGDGAGACVYVVNANTTADTRIGHIEIGGNTYTVTQHGYAATISPSSASFDRRGGSGTIDVATEAGILWTAVANDDWIIIGEGSGTSIGTASYTVEPYLGVVTRAGTISIAGQTFSITQTGADVNLQPEEITVKPDVDLISVAVTALATTKWEVSTDADWVSVIDKESGYGDYVLTLVVNANPSFARRFANVQIGTATLVVEQEGVETTALSINPPEARASASGAYGNVAVLATPDAPWKAESLTPWLTISEGVTGAGNGNIKYVVSANPTLEERTGLIRISPQNQAPNLDLTAGLMCRCPSFTSDEGNGERYFQWGDTVEWSDSTQTDLQSAANTWLKLSVSTGCAKNTTSWDGKDSIKLSGSSDRASVTTKVSGPGILTWKWCGGYYYYYSTYSGSSYSYYLYSTVDGSDSSSSGSSVGSWLIGNRTITGNGFHSIEWRDSSAYSYPGYLDYITWTSTASSIPFDGSSACVLNGAAFPKKDCNDFSVAVSFSVGELNRMNRLMSLSDASFYLNNENRLVFNTVETSFVVDAANKFYTFVVRQDTDGVLSVFAGVQGEELRRVLECECKTIIVFTEGDVSTGVVKLGGSDLPTPGLLTSGEMKDFRMWSRALTDTESRNVDVHEGESHDVQPKYMPQGVACEYLPLNQNMYTRGRDGLRANNCAVKSVGFYEADDRYGIRQRAIKSENAGEIFMPDVRSLFASDEKDATVSMWFRFDELPNEGSVALMRRYCPSSTANTTDKQVAVLVSSSGNLLLDNNGVISEFETVSVGEMEWHLLTLVGKATKSLQLYLDDVEIGNVSSTATLGYAPSGLLHATFGGGACAIDDLTIYHTDFTSAQVRELYEASRPKPICHTVHQGIQSAQLNETNFYVAAEGCNLEVSLTVAQSAQWQAVPNCDWIAIASDDRGAGSATVAFTVAPTTVVTNRIGSVTIAGIEVMVEQEGLWADVECEVTSFGVESNFGTIYVETEGAGMWEAKTDCAWIHLLDAQGNGPGVVTFVIDDYNTTTDSRSGVINVAGKKIVINQQGYELSIDPAIAEIGSNVGAGQFGVAAPIDAVWEAIADCDWITIVGARTGIGDGTIQYTVTDNLTGETRVGRIVIGGKAYTITQRTTLPVTTQVIGRGSVTGAGNYNQGTKVTLKATAANGYVFSHWSGDAVGIRPDDAPRCAP